MQISLLKKYTYILFIILSTANTTTITYYYYYLFQNQNRKSDRYNIQSRIETPNSHNLNLNVETFIPKPIYISLSLSSYDSHSPIILVTIIPIPSLHSFHGLERRDQTGPENKLEYRIYLHNSRELDMGERRKGKKTRLGEKLVHRSRIGMSRTRTTRFRVFVGSLPPPFPCPKKLDFAVGGGGRQVFDFLGWGAIVTGRKVSHRWNRGTRNGFPHRSFLSPILSPTEERKGGISVGGEGEARSVRDYRWVIIYGFLQAFSSCRRFERSNLSIV